MQVDQQVERILFIVVGMSGAVIGVMLCLIAFTILGAFVLLVNKSKRKKRKSMQTLKELNLK